MRHALGEKITTKHFDSYVPRDPFDNVRYRNKMLRLASTDVTAQRVMFKLCSEDPLFYINTFNYSFSPKDSIYGTPLTPFTLYDFQCETILDLLDCVDRGIDGALPKSRGVGASYLGINVIEWCWHFRPLLAFLMVSRMEKLVDDSANSDALFYKIDFMHRYQPRWLLPTGRERGLNDPGRKLLSLRNADNQSVISGEATTENIGVGGRRTMIFFDEFALLKQGPQALSGSRDVTNCRIFNSTPRGQNHFYEVCTKVAPKVMRLHWSRHDIFAQGLYTREEDGTITLLDDFRGMVRFRAKGEKEIQELMFPDDYPFQPTTRFKLRSPWFDYECTRCANEKEISQELEIDFLGSEYQFFDAETILILKKKYCIEPELVGDLEFDPVTFQPRRFVEHEKGKLKLWITPGMNGRFPTDRRFVLGADVSAGTGASHSCACVVDRDTGEKVAVWKDPNTLPDPFANESMAIAKYFNMAHMVWDRSGPTGEVFTKAIVRGCYGDIYYRRNEKKIGREITDEPGVFLNTNAKSVILHEYREAITTHRYINRSETGLDECLQFIKQPDGSVEHSAAANATDPDGARTAHGDEVIADALACLGMTDRQQNKKQQESVEPPVGSLAHRMKRRAAEERAAKSDDLGKHW